ncbi:MAG: hypothetical protein NVS4B6_14870 [Mycobacterium sp.]
MPNSAVATAANHFACLLSTDSVYARVLDQGPMWPKRSLGDVGYPPGRPLSGCGAPGGVTGAVLGSGGFGGADGGGIADIDCQVSQSTAQSQMSPSA